MFGKKQYYIIFVILGLFFYGICTFLRMTAPTILLNNITSLQMQFFLILYSLIVFTIGWALWVLPTKVLYTKWILHFILPAAILGSVLEYIINDQNKWLTGSFWSNLYDITIYLTVFYFFVLLFRNHRQDKVTERTHIVVTKVSKDDHFISRPSLGTGADELNRDGFSRHLAAMLHERINTSTDHALTIGLYGPWGSGKSSIFDMIEDKYIDRNKVTVIRFHPWYMGKDHYNIIPEFLKLMIHNLRNNDALKDESDLMKHLTEYVKYLTPLSLRPPGMIINFKEFNNNPELAKEYAEAQTMRERIVDSLKSLHIPILVFIDDLDRLDNKEIQMVFKLVRLIADFPNTTYLIAMDEEVVAKSLAQHYSKDYDINTGLKYIEKFIHVPVYLPQVDPAKLHKFLLRRMQPILTANNVVLSEGFIWEMLIQFQFSPRNIERLINIIQVHLPLLKDETYHEDLISLLAIKVDNPELFTFIYKHPKLFIGKVKEKSKEDEATLEQLRTQYSRLLPWLERMFPGLTGKSASITEHRHKRISSEVHFNTYFMYSVSDRKLSQKIINAFYEVLLTGNLDIAADVYKEMVVSSNLEETNVKLMWDLDDKREDLNFRLLTFLLEQFEVENIHSSVKELREELIRSLLNSEVANDALNLIFTHKDNLILAMQAYRSRVNELEIKRIIGKFIMTKITANDWINMDYLHAKAVFDILKEVEDLEDTRLRFKNWFEHLPVWKMASILISTSLDEELMLFRQYANLISFVPVEYIERDVKSYGKIYGRNEIKQALNNEEDPVKVILSYVHNWSYDYAEYSLRQMEEISAVWEVGLMVALQEISDYGLPERAAAIKLRFENFLEKNKKAIAQ